MGSGKTLALMLASARMLCETRDLSAPRCVYFDLEYQLSIPHFVRLLSSTLAITLREKKTSKMKKKKKNKSEKSKNLPSSSSTTSVEKDDNQKEKKMDDNDDDVITADIITSMLKRIDIVRPRSIRELAYALEQLCSSTLPPSMTSKDMVADKQQEGFIALICLDGFCSSWQYQIKAKIAGLDDPGLQRALSTPSKRRSTSLPPRISSSSSSSSSFSSTSASTTAPPIPPPPPPPPTLLPITIKCKESAYKYESLVLNRLSNALQAARRHHRHCRIIWTRRLSFEGPSRIARSLRLIGIPRADVAKHLQNVLGRASYSAEILNRVRPSPSYDPFTGPSLTVTGTKSEWVSHPINYFNFNPTRERGFGPRIPPETPASLEALKHAITPSLVPYSLDQLITAQVFLSAAQLPPSQSRSSSSFPSHLPPPPPAPPRPPALKPSRLKSSAKLQTSFFSEATQLLSSPDPLPPALPAALLLSLKKRIDKKSSEGGGGGPPRESSIKREKRKAILKALIKKERNEQALQLSTDPELLQFPVTVNVLSGLTTQPIKEAQHPIDPSAAIKEGIYPSSTSVPISSSLPLSSSSSSSSSMLMARPSTSSSPNSQINGHEKSILDIRTSLSFASLSTDASFDPAHPPISSSSSTSASTSLLFSTAVERQATTTAMVARLIRSTSTPYRSSASSASLLRGRGSGGGGSAIPESLLFVTTVSSVLSDDDDDDDNDDVDEV